MNIINAREVQSNLSELMARTIKGPIVIQKYGRPAAALISIEDYDKFQKLEELYWQLKVKEAEEDGYLSVAETDDLLDSILKS